MAKATKKRITINTVNNTIVNQSFTDEKSMVAFLRPFFVEE